MTVINKTSYRNKEVITLIKQFGHVQILSPLPCTFLQHLIVTADQLTYLLHGAETFLRS